MVQITTENGTKDSNNFIEVEKFQVLGFGHPENIKQLVDAEIQSILLENFTNPERELSTLERALGLYNRSFSTRIEFGKVFDYYRLLDPVGNILSDHGYRVIYFFSMIIEAKPDTAILLDELASQDLRDCLKEVRNIRKDCILINCK